jgi:outer membrane receptor protein involved in Fe transport
LTALTFDPCQGTNPVGNATLTNICIAQGAPAGTIGTIDPPSAAQVNATAGGNPNLDVETAKSWTVGAVITPSFLPRFSLTADYYHVKIDGAITNPTPGDILTPCFGPNNDGNGTNPAACALIGRNPLNGSLNGGGDTAGLILALSNQGTLETSGIDVHASYQVPTGFGSINFDFSGNWTEQLKFQATPTDINRECVGQYSNNCEPITPEFAFNLRTTVNVRDLVDVSLLWTWLQGVEYERIQDPTGILPEYLEIPSYNYLDLTVRYHATENVTLTAGVVNLFDKDPPNVSSFIGSSSFNSGNTYPTTYDALGRRFQATARVRF